MPPEENRPAPVQGPEILRWTSNVPGNYGGYHRTLQLEELILSTGVRMRDLAPYPHKFKERLRNYGSGLAYCFRSRPGRAPSLRNLWSMGYERRVFLDYFARHTKQPLLVAEFTGRVAPVHCGKPATMRVLALPHNLESFYDRHHSKGDRKIVMERLILEVGALGAADAVFCISETERWLLNLMGVNAELLPYFPPQPVADRMWAIRTRRGNERRSDRILALGSAVNVDTAAGLTKLLSWFDSGRLSTPLDVVGSKTRELAGLTRSDKVAFHGTVTNEELDNLLATTRGVLIHQGSGTGMLTRIPELLLAGVPVIANGVSARSCRHLSGVHLYETPGELSRCLNSDLPTPPELARPVAAEQRFCSTLKGFLAESSPPCPSR